MSDNNNNNNNISPMDAEDSEPKTVFRDYVINITKNPAYEKKSDSEKEQEEKEKQEKNEQEEDEQEQPRASPKKRLRKNSCNDDDDDDDNGNNDEDDDSDNSSMASDSEDEQIPKKKLRTKPKLHRYTSDDEPKCHRYTSDDEPKPKRQRYNLVEDEAEVDIVTSDDEPEPKPSDTDTDDLAFTDDEAQKKPEPKKSTSRHCSTLNCVLLAVRDKKYCSGCGRSRREKKARALRKEARRIEEAEYELRHKYQRNLIRQKQQARRAKLDAKMRALKEKFKNVKKQ